MLFYHSIERLSLSALHHSLNILYSEQTKALDTTQRLATDICIHPFICKISVSEAKVIDVLQLLLN